MKTFVKICRRFLRDEDAPTATEYAVMLALIIVVAIGAVTLLGQRVSSTMGAAANQLPGGQ
jgi:pilus assembly protein Flp/PilA